MPPGLATNAYLDDEITSIFGLMSLSDDKPLADVALISVDIDARIKDIAYSVELHYHFRNDGANPLEAKYLFPVFSGATVCGFKACIGGRTVEGHVMESGEAQQVYNDAIEQGHGAYKLEKTQADVFEMAVGNLPPSCDCKITITVVGMTETGQGTPGTNVFRLPTTVAPRYSPQSNPIHSSAKSSAIVPGKGSAAKKRKTPPVQRFSRQGEEMYAMRLHVFVQTKSKVVQLDCTSHTDSAEVDLMGLSARLSLKEQLLDRDFVMSYRSDDGDKPRISVEVPKLPSTLAAAQVTERALTSEESRAAVMVCMHPDLSGENQMPGEYIFILDRSGSMNGESIVHARNAVAEALLCLHPSSTFNAVSFGSDMELMFKKPKVATPAAVKGAVNKLRGMEADLGGTEIIKPLAYALMLPRPCRGTLGLRQRQIFFLTDGSVWNQDDCFALVSKHSKENRVFSFGIGPCASSSLVKGIAKAGRGTATFVNSTNMSAVVEQVQRSMEPCIIADRLEWSHQGLSKPLNVELDPVPIFRGQRLALFFFAAFDRTAAFGIPPPEGCGDRAGATSTLPLPIECTVKLGLLDHAGNPLLPSTATGEAEMSDEGEHGTNVISRLAAQNRVTSLADRSLLSSDEDVQQRCKEEIVKLGVQYQIATDHTSFVAVEERDASSRSDPARLERQLVPNTLPATATGPYYPPAGGAHRARSKHNSKARKRGHPANEQQPKPPEPTPYGVTAASAACGAIGDFQRAFLGPVNDVDRQANDCWLDAALSLLTQIAPLRDELARLARGADKERVIDGSCAFPRFGTALGKVMLAWQRLLRTSAGSSRRALDSAKRGLWDADQLPAMGFVHGQTYSLEFVLRFLLSRLVFDGVVAAARVRVVSNVGCQTEEALFSGDEWRWMLVLGSQASGVIQLLRKTSPRRRPARLVAFASAEHISLLPEEDAALSDDEDDQVDTYAWHYTVWSPDQHGGYWVYDDLMGLPVEEGCHLGIQGGYVPPTAPFAARTLESASDAASVILLTKDNK